MEPVADTGIAMLTLQFVHTLVYGAGQVSVLVVLWCGVTGRQSPWLKYSVACLTVIVVARILNGGPCPLYSMAIWLAGAQPGDPVRDMLTPIWFNELVTPVNLPLGVLGMALIAWRSIGDRWQQAEFVDNA
jgi:hypothetical protein